MIASRNFHPMDILTRTGSGPRLIVRHDDPGFVAAVVRQCRCRGGLVHEASSVAEVRRLAYLHRSAVVVLDADGKDETGWLTCAKLTRERPACRVVLVSRDLGSECYRLAHFVGAAALVGREEGVSSLLDRVESLAPAPAAE